jgi:hypothetical protein
MTLLRRSTLRPRVFNVWRPEPETRQVENSPPRSLSDGQAWMAG